MVLIVVCWSAANLLTHHTSSSPQFVLNEDMELTLYNLTYQEVHILTGVDEVNRLLI